MAHQVKSSRASKKSAVHEYHTCVKFLRVLRRFVTFSEWLRMQDWKSWDSGATETDHQKALQSVLSAVQKVMPRSKGGCRTRNDVRTGRWDDNVCVPSRMDASNSRMVQYLRPHVVEHHRTQGTASDDRFRYEHDPKGHLLWDPFDAKTGRRF